MVAGILAAHVAGVWGLMQVGAVRDAVRDAAPMFVDLIAPEAPPVPPAPVPPPPPPPPTPQPIRKPPPPRPVIAAAPSPAPAAFVVPAPPPEPVVEVPEPLAALPTPAAPPAPPASPAPAPLPRNLPASAVQYLEPPVLAYPRLSMRNGESGRVLVRVYIDTAGLPRNVQLNASSGFARLDDAAVMAVGKARFKPYIENGQPTAGWALIPLKFELER
ncbi:MAG: energy transducer TonB [Burkholderiaceae bacterium]